LPSTSLSASGQDEPAVIDRWREFWFEQVPPHTFAVYRIGIGIAGIATIIGAWDTAFWRVDGLAPLPGGGLGLRDWLLDRGLSEPFGAALRTALLAGYTLLLLGIRSAATAVVMFAASSLMLWWNWYPYSGAQHLLHNLTLYLVLGNSGAVWSYDAWRSSRRGEPTGAPQPVFPLRLVRCQMAVMYFAAGLWKLGNPDWRSGDALYYVLNSNVFQRMPGVLPAELYPVTVVLTYVTLFWELLFPVLLWWPPTRVLAIGLGVALHLGMWSTIEIGAFSLTVLAGYTAFLNPRLTESRVTAVMRRLGLQRTPPSASPSLAS
jgi:hypothetical protein